MNSTTKKILWIGTSILIVLLVLIFAFGKQLGLPLAVTGGGLTPVSISNVQVTTNGQTASQIVIYATAQGGNYLNVVLGPNNLNQYLQSQGYTATKSITLSGNYNGGSVSFPYTNTGVSPQLITLLGSTSYWTTLTNNGALNGCKSVYPTTIAAVYQGGILGGENCYGAGSSYNNGVISGFSAGVSQYAYSFSFNYLGQTVTLSNNQQSVSFSDGSHIDGIGSLLSNTLLTTPQYQVYQLGNQNTLVSQGVGNSITNAYSILLSCFNTNGNTGTYGMSSTSYNSCYSTYQQTISGALADKSSEYLSTIASVSPTGIAFQNGQLVVSVAQPTINIPTFTITLNAQSVGIERLSGTPQIQKPCPNPPILNGAGTTSTTIQVANVGNEPGFFDVGLSCGSGISAYSNGQTVEPGQTLPFGVQVSGSTPTQSTNTQSCTFTATDRNSGASDSCSFSATVKYSSFTSQCNVPGLTQCSLDGKTLLTCTNGQFQPTLCSSVNSSYVCIVPNGGVAQCGAEPGAGNETCPPITLIPSIVGSKPVTIPNYPCIISNWFKNLIQSIGTFFFIIEIITTLLISILVLIASKGLIEEHTRMKPTLVWIFSLIIAFLVGLLVFEVFWIGVIVGIAILIIKGLLPGGKIRAIMGR